MPCVPVLSQTSSEDGLAESWLWVWNNWRRWVVIGVKHLFIWLRTEVVRLGAFEGQMPQVSIVVRRVSRENLWKVNMLSKSYWQSQYTKTAVNQWSNYEGAWGSLAPWKTGWPFETPGLRGYKGASKRPPWNHPSNSIHDCNISISF